MGLYGSKDQHPKLFETSYENEHLQSLEWVYCEKCGHRHLKQYDKCPECGHPRKSKSGWHRFWKIAAIIQLPCTLIFIWGIFILASENLAGHIENQWGSKDSDEVFANPPYYSPSTTKQPETNVTPNKAYSDQDILAYRDEYCNACESIDYITLARNPDKYKGNLYKITGKVIQVMEANGGAFVRMDVTKGEYGYWTDTIASAIRIPKGSDRILEDDIITIYGECYGLYTYETVLGSEMSIPRIDAMFYELITEP